MFRILLMAGVALAGCVTAAHFIDLAARVRASATSGQSQAESVSSNMPSPSSSRSLVIRAGNNGHFKVDARVDGRRVDFMVDTGASHITLRESEAARLGIRPS